MGARGPKPSFTKVACPNTQCRHYAQIEQGNIVGNGRYRIRSGFVRTLRCSAKFPLVCSDNLPLSPALFPADRIVEKESDCRDGVQPLCQEGVS
jgi:hypothetical protein